MKLDLSGYDVAEKMWKPCGSIEVDKEDKHFAEGGFRYAFLATSVNPGTKEKWVIKVTKEEDLVPVTEAFNITVTQHTRKQVQMHAVARSVANSFTKGIPAGFGSFFKYHKVYFSTMKGKPVTVEAFIPGEFQKYINNNGEIRKSESVKDRILTEKAECLVHYSYVHTNKQMMILDLQGVEYVLCDPEIATAILHEDGELNFCAGNLSVRAISTFFAEHSCNNYCRMLDLAQEEQMF